MWDGARSGRCGIDFIKGFDTEQHKVKVAGELKNFDITDHMDRMAARRTARFTQLALVAAREAFAQSGLDTVSYTHLDVYKRQARGLDWLCRTQSHRADHRRSAAGRLSAC